MMRPPTDKLLQELLRLCPGYAPHWRADYDYAGGEVEHPRYWLFGSFSTFIAEQLQRRDTTGLPRLFAWIETVVAGKDDDLANAAQTCFLENLLNVVPSKIDPDLFVPLLGPESARWCRVWDEFTGCRTKGLW